MNKQELQEEVRQVLWSIKNKDIRRTARHLVESNEESFYSSPAACGNHHVFQGGLATHLVDTANMAKGMVDYYGARLKSYVDRDVVVAGAFLHDIGKVACYKYDWNNKKAVTSTKESLLFHHIPIGFAMLQKALDEHAPDLVKNRRDNLLHCIIAHHGRIKWSSPREPKTIEAWIVHQADYFDAWLDSKVKFNVMSQ